MCLEDSVLIQAPRSTFPPTQASLPIHITISPDPEVQILKTYESDDKSQPYELLSHYQRNSTTMV